LRSLWSRRSAEPGGSRYAPRPSSARAAEGKASKERTCSLIRAWKRRGFRRSAIPQEVTALSEALPRLGRSTTKIARAERRLLQLGVKSRAARAFNADLLFSGAFGEDGGGAFGSTEISTETEVAPAR